MSVRISGSIGGRPVLLRLFQVQWSLKPLRCQPITVWGFTMSRALCQSGHRRQSVTQNARSAFVSLGRLVLRFRERGNINDCAVDGVLRRHRFSRVHLFSTKLPQWTLCESSELQTRLRSWRLITSFPIE